MSLVICPKITKYVKNEFKQILEVFKIPVSKTKFWHDNFKDNFYMSVDGLIRVLLTGYSGAVAGQAILEYAEHYLKDDPKKEIYFIGRVYAFSDSCLEPGNLVIARDTFSPDSFEQEIYKNAHARGITNVTKPDEKLVEKIVNIANQQNIILNQGEVYCTIAPGFFPDFQKPPELMNEAMWWKLSFGEIYGYGCNCGEYESAAVLATSKLFGIPAVAVFDVKDKRYSRKNYILATKEQKEKSLYTLLNIVKKSILSP